MQEDKIKDLFGSKLSNFEPEVPASVWAGIDQLLSQQPPMQTPDSPAEQTGSSGGSSGTALKTVFIALALAASLAAGVFFLSDSHEDTPMQVSGGIEAPAVAQPEIEQPLPQEAPAATAPSPVFARVRRTVAPAAEAAEPETVHEPETAVAPETAETDEIEETEEVEETEEMEALPIVKFIKEDISLLLSTNIGVLSSSVSQKGGALLFSGEDRSAAFNDLLKEENENYTLTHSQPISIGFGVSKYMTRKISLETGLVFTYLSSKITSESALNIEEKQTFGYLGVPVYINYEFYRFRKTKFYLSLGAMMQKDVFGKYTSRFVFSEDILGIGSGSADYDMIYLEPRYLKKDISQSNWQFSSHLNVGAAFPVYGRLYFYSQIGGAYYFDADNDYRTIFSDRKLQLNLNLGLRIDF